ncbi:MAG: type II toxin-antitoxin system HicA family toxin [Candidatus Kapabacteria bacterium]|nr:type II toxin-antitoxin system HicA family toxin [Candidatus Kapabacteria bacterium]
MSKIEKILKRINDPNVATNIGFEELVNLLEYLGFERRQKGSHTIFRKEGIIEKINLQKDGSKAKIYQINQVRKILNKYNIEKM